MKAPPYRYEFMLLAPKKKIRYIQIPKNGSQSIMHMMINHLDSKENWLDIRTDVPNEKDYFTFTFVRNPWDRLISAYQDRIHKHWRPQKLQFYGYKQNMSFKSFIELTCSLGDNNIDHHMRSQCWFTKFKPLDFIGKLEKKEDWNYLVREIIGTNDLLKRNRTNHQDRFKMFSNSRLKELVEKRYQEDIETFKYEFKRN